MSSLKLTTAELLSLPFLQAKWCASADAPGDELKGISTDSRTVQKGQLFFALEGNRVNGHSFVTKALQNGAAAVVVNREWHDENKNSLENAAVISVPDTLMAYQELARYYRGKFDIPAIAITGSSGKTTSKEIIAAVLSQKYHVLKNIKSYNNAVGVPATLFEIRPEHEIVIAEVGTNHFGELNRLSQIVKPSACVLINIGHAHLEFFHDLAGVARAKMEIFNYADASGTAIYNADDPWLAKQDYPVASKLSFGLTRGDVQGEIIGCDSSANYSFMFSNRIVHLHIPGRHNVTNALAAAAVGILFQVDADNICEGIESVKAVEKRMQTLQVGTVTILDDSYNSNPGSCRAALATLVEMNHDKRGRHVAVLGDMLELGQMSFQEHRDLGDDIVAYELDALFTFGKEMSITADRVMQLGFKKVNHFLKMDELVTALMDYIRSDDIILVKGSRGMSMERVIEQIRQRIKN